MLVLKHLAEITSYALLHNKSYANSICCKRWLRRQYRRLANAYAITVTTNNNDNNNNGRSKEEQFCMEQHTFCTSNDNKNTESKDNERSGNVMTSANIICQNSINERLRRSLNVANVNKKLYALLSHVNSQSIWEISSQVQKANVCSLENKFESLIDKVKCGKYDENLERYCQSNVNDVVVNIKLLECICEIITVLEWWIKRVSVSLETLRNKHDCTISNRKVRLVKRVEQRLRCSYAFLIYQLFTIAITNNRNNNNNNIEVMLKEAKGNLPIKTGMPLREQETISYTNTTLRKSVSLSKVADEMKNNNSLLITHKNNNKSNKNDNNIVKHNNEDDSISQNNKDILNIFPESRLKEHVHSMIKEVPEEQIVKICQLIHISLQIVQVIRQAYFRMLILEKHLTLVARHTHNILYHISCLPGIAVVEQLPSHVLCELISLYARCTDGVTNDNKKSASVPTEENDKNNKSIEVNMEQEKESQLISYCSKLFSLEEETEVNVNNSAYEEIVALLPVIESCDVTYNIDLLAWEILRRIRSYQTEYKMLGNNITVSNKQRSNNINNNNNNTYNRDIYRCYNKNFNANWSKTENAKLQLLSLRDRKAIIAKKSNANSQQQQHQQQNQQKQKQREYKRCKEKYVKWSSDCSFAEHSVHENVNTNQTLEMELLQWKIQCFTLREIDEICTNLAFLRYRDTQFWQEITNNTCVHIEQFTREMRNSMEEGEMSEEQREHLHTAAAATAAGATTVPSYTNRFCYKNNKYNKNKNYTYKQVQRQQEQEKMLCYTRHILYALDFVGESSCYTKLMNLLVTNRLVKSAIPPPSIAAHTMRDVRSNFTDSVTGKNSHAPK